MIHAFGKHIHWSESLYFSFYDRAKDLCGFMMIELKPNMSVKEMFCYLLMPDGSMVSLREPVPFDRPTLDAKGLRFDIIEPEKRWGVSFVGGMERSIERKTKKSHVEVELQFDALNEVFDHRVRVSAEGGKMPAGKASGHVEQVGRFTGRISSGLDDFTIDTSGERSHSWGVRDWGASKGWTRLTCQFSESHALGLTRTVTDEGPTDSGFVFMDGRNVPVAAADLNVNVDFDKNPKSFDMTIHDELGGDHKVFGSVIKRVGVHFKSLDGNTMTVMNEALTRYTIAGKNGYGIAEFLSRTE